MLSKTLMPAIVAAVALIAQSGQAAPSNPERSIQVRYDDLELGETGQVEVLLHRIRKAAVAVCQTDGNGIADIEQFDACYDQAVAKAVAAVRAPKLTQAWQGDSHDAKEAGERP